MKKEIIYGVVGVLIGIIGGYAFSFSAPMKHSVVDIQKAPAAMGSEKVLHPQLEVDKTKSIPSVAIEAIPDTKDGYNIHVTTQNYLFTPEKVGGAPVANEGHAHLFVNGTKVARLYGNWFQIGSSLLKDGANSIEVTLNANDHSEWTVDGADIAAETSVNK